MSLVERVPQAARTQQFEFVSAFTNALSQFVWRYLATEAPPF
jgi:hypothetical protein